MKKSFLVALIAAATVMGGCATIPDGPSVLVLPGSSKSFDQFRVDEQECRQYASSQIGGTNAAQASVDSGVRSAALGTVLGAAAGAAIDGSRGAGVGAATGLVFGSLAGAGAGQGSAYAMQSRYDAGYMQCMYAKGNRVPVSASAYRSHQAARYYYPPPPPLPPY